MFRAMKVPRVLLLAAIATMSVAASADAATVVHFEHESYPAFEKQLSAHQIHAATFNKKAHTLHLSMNDGRHLLVSYPSHNEPQIAAALEAKGVPVTVEKKAAKAKPAVHHTLRYVAGGILVLVIVVVAAVLLVDRRRKLGEEGGGETPPPTQSQPLQ